MCWTDFFQGILMLAALLAIPIVVTLTQDIDTGLLQNIYQYTDASGKAVVCDFGSGIFSADLKTIISGLGWGLGYFGMPHILVRFMSIEKPSMIKKSAIVAIIWVILALAAGVWWHTWEEYSQVKVVIRGAQETVFMVMARKFFMPVFSGLLLAAIMAACISTADSQLLVASSSFTSDIYKPIIHKNASDKEVLWVGRTVVVLVALIAFAIASSEGGCSGRNESGRKRLGLFWSGFRADNTAVSFWRKFNYYGAVAGGDIGCGCRYTLADVLTETGIYEIIPGFICSLAVAVIASKITGEPPKEVKDIFDTANADDFDE